LPSDDCVCVPNNRRQTTVPGNTLYSEKRPGIALDFLIKQEGLINIVLRLYTGLFTDFARIDEGEIATRLKIERQEVYENLQLLSQRDIVKYIPAKKTPFIVFTQERQNHEKITISKAVYEERKKRFEERIAVVLNYAESENICRNKMLLAYFGDKSARNCGVCDVCLRDKRKNLKNNEFEIIQNEIKNLLQKQSLSLNQLVDSLNFEEEKSLNVIRFMIDNDILFYDDEKKLRFAWLFFKKDVLLQLVFKNLSLKDETRI